MKPTYHLAGPTVRLKRGTKHRKLIRCMICGLLLEDTWEKTPELRMGTWVKHLGRGKFVPTGSITCFFLFTQKELPRECCSKKLKGV